MNNKLQTVNCLSKDVSMCLKGAFAVLVLLHHFQQRADFIAQSHIGVIFRLLGFLSVSVFLFFSGYGLILSYKKKAELYLKSFLKSRLIPFYCIYVFLVFLSAVKNVIIGTPIRFTDILYSLVLVKNVITYGWYLQAILIFYIAFYIIFCMIKDKNKAFWLLFSFVVAYMLVRHFTNAEPALYISTLSFVSGMIFAKYPEKIQSLFKNYKLTFFVSAVAFGVVMASGLLNANRHTKYTLYIIASVLFTLSILTLTEFLCNINRKIIVNRFMQKLGSISLEIYVAQGFFFDIFRSELIYIDSKYAYLSLVGISTFLLAILLHPIFSAVYSFFKKDLIA